MIVLFNVGCLRCWKMSMCSGIKATFGRFRCRKFASASFRTLDLLFVFFDFDLC